ncbi:hypothetical protein QBC46DRAFT_438138 [Diplogelasinospora grovesii]|uniref:Uncharacterized protein n=1 Tax=Diplogelasinospora grovesii TaxID=303347 RepID=A0AAN6N8L1_9PEZI|nr:hypothetical protein QBC46DRAFT_438138 [Diplogelasinospora grovesii]
MAGAEQSEGTQYNRALDNVKKSVLEMEMAEQSFDVILTMAASGQMQETYVADGTIKPGPLKLIADLRDYFSCRRRKLREDHPLSPLDFGERGVVENLEQLGKITIKLKTEYKCLCPLTVLLQQKAESLPAETCPDVESSEYKDWGVLAPLRNILVDFQDRKTEGENDKTEGENDETTGLKASLRMTGLLRCLMFHEDQDGKDDSKKRKFTVTLSAPSYRDDLPDHIENTVQKPKEDSETRIKPKTTFKFSKKELVTGVGATFALTGDYKLTCLLDFERFKIVRPYRVECLETDTFKASERGRWGVESCAEWEL